MFYIDEEFEEYAQSSNHKITENKVDRILPFRVLILEDKPDNDYIYAMFEYDFDLKSAGYDHYPMFHINNLGDMDSIYNKIDFSKYHLLILDYGGLGDLGWGNDFAFMRRVEHFIKKKLLNKFDHIILISRVYYEDDEFAQFMKEQGVIFVNCGRELKEEVLKIYEEYKENVRRILENKINHHETVTDWVRKFRLVDLNFYKNKIEYSVEVTEGDIFCEDVTDLQFFEIDENGKEKYII